jgi:dipeptidyl aminopeptidase/acylaminoacyl peptidase
VADVVIEPRRADKERPVGDEAFRAILSMYAFDPAPLDDRLEALDDSAPHWRRETVSFRAAYGDERVPAYVYLPRQGRPPYQAVVYWPGADAFFLRSSENLRTLDFDFLVRSGRAVIFPVYQGTYERRGGAEGGPNAWRDRIILGMKDLRRAVDYLAGRSDIDEERIAYYGLSSGANRGPIALALEPRLKTAILVAGGLWYQPRAPEVETLNFAPRIRQPVLMINGRYDFDEPYETLQLPLFRLLGTPAGHKRHVVLDSGHVPPRNDTIRESLAWLDHYLGPV